MAKNDKKLNNFLCKLELAGRPGGDARCGGRADHDG